MQTFNSPSNNVDDKTLKLINQSQEILVNLFSKWKSEHSKVLTTKKMLDSCFYFMPNGMYCDCMYKDFIMHVTPFDRSDSVQYGELFVRLANQLRMRTAIERELASKLNTFRSTMLTNGLDEIYGSLNDILASDKMDELYFEYEQFECGVYVLSRILTALNQFGSLDRIIEMRKKFDAFHTYYIQRFEETTELLSSLRNSSQFSSQIQDVTVKIFSDTFVEKNNMILNDFTEWFQVLMSNSIEIQATTDEEVSIYDNEIIPGTDEDEPLFQSSQPRDSQEMDAIDNGDFYISPDGIVPMAQRGTLDQKIDGILNHLEELNIELAECQLKYDSLYIWILKDEKLISVYLKVSEEKKDELNGLIDNIHAAIATKKNILDELKLRRKDKSSNSDPIKRVRELSTQDHRTKRIMQINQDLMFLVDYGDNLENKVDLHGEMASQREINLITTFHDIRKQLERELRMHENDERVEKRNRREEQIREIESEQRIRMSDPNETRYNVICPLSRQRIVQFDENGNEIQYVVNRGCGHIFHKDTYDVRVQLRDEGHGGQDGMFCMCESELNAWPFSQTQQHWPIGWVWPEQENPKKKKKRD